jgi:Protein of unknown function (DUF3866)
VSGIAVEAATVVAVTARRPGATELSVRVDGADGDEAAIGYDQLTGELAAGDRVAVNTTAVRLGLGTGGLHVVMARLDAGARPAGPPHPDHPGHIIKARYTPSQVAVLAVEEEASPHRAAVAAVDDLDGLPVVAAELHSMVPVIAAAARAADRGVRVAYVMSDGAALPFGLSRLAERMRTAGLLAGTLTAGQAFGGDLEAITVHSALAAAKAVLGADVVVVAQGPGGAGSGTRFGFSGVQMAEAVNAAGALGGRPLACLRLSGADARDRHRGVSHHTLTALGRLALARALVAVPVLDDPALAAVVGRQLEQAGVAARHELVEVAQSPPAAELLAAWGLEVATMGRGPAADPAFFAAAAAAGTLAGRLAAGALPGPLPGARA